ncbi:MAG TPA: histidine phosphatase family protein [Symbiobacteriaceae bacterium]|nr:histidine phosphatase family protein [Symbiobacteriaceae bacterium]
MKTTLALVRHGVTEWNYSGRAQGHVDIPLSAEGHHQAELVAQSLANESWDAIYASDLSRARQTAEAIGRALDLPVKTDPRLRERFMGQAEGMTHWDRNDRWPGLTFMELPEVEQDDLLAERSVAAVQALAEQHAGERLICVAHGAFIHLFLEAVAPDSGYGWRQRNTAITVVEWDGAQFQIVRPPDFAHLYRDGVEYTGEKNRIRPALVAELLGDTCTVGIAEAILQHATAVEGAWSSDDQFVGFARAFTDGVRFGHIDILATAPGFDHVQAILVERLQTRYPNVTFTR